MSFITKGLCAGPVQIVTSAIFREGVQADEGAREGTSELFSFCEHHLMPFVGKAHVAPLYPTDTSPACRRSPAWWSATHAACRCRNASRCRYATAYQRPQPPRRGRGHRGKPHVHADARHRETGLGDNDVGLYRVFLKDNPTREEFFTLISKTVSLRHRCPRRRRQTTATAPNAVQAPSATARHRNRKRPKTTNIS